MINYHKDIIQGTDEWFAVRCGILTASEMKLIITPTLKIASNEKERSHLFELLAQRITGFVEPSYVSDDMLRGKEDELDAKILYNERVAPIEDMGFITNDKFGFTLGFSPDGLVGDDGFVECKSRRQKFQVETIINLNMPADFVLQVQTGFLVSERKWCDFLSYSGGLPMPAFRIHPDQKVQDAILEASSAFEKRLSENMEKYNENLKLIERLMPTKRRVEQEIVI